jgi:hypothetical protein
MNNQIIDPSTIPGWGIDADTRNDPTYPMRNIEGDDKRGMNWQRPGQQQESVEILQSIERKNRPAVFGTSTPPSGLSGILRRLAFRYSESDWIHWLTLMAADRINVVEGLFQDLGRLKVPNIPQEMGLRSELAHNRDGLIKKVAISGVLIGLVIVASRMRSERPSGRRRTGTRHR